MFTLHNIKELCCIIASFSKKKFSLPFCVCITMLIQQMSLYFFFSNFQSSLFTYHNWVFKKTTMLWKCINPLTDFLWFWYFVTFECCKSDFNIKTNNLYKKNQLLSDYFYLFFKTVWFFAVFLEPFCLKWHPLHQYSFMESANINGRMNCFLLLPLKMNAQSRPMWAAGGLFFRVSVFQLYSCLVSSNNEPAMIYSHVTIFRVTVGC